MGFGSWLAFVVTGSGGDHGLPHEATHPRQAERRARRSQTASTNNVTGRTQVTRARRRSGDLGDRWRR
jgi:hypothetical protein